MQYFMKEYGKLDECIYGTAKEFMIGHNLGQGMSRSSMFYLLEGDWWDNLKLTEFDGRNNFSTPELDNSVER